MDPIVSSSSSGISLPQSLNGIEYMQCAQCPALLVSVPLAWAGLGLATAQPKLVVQRPRGWAQLGHARLGMPKQLIGLATD